MGQKTKEKRRGGVTARPKGKKGREKATGVSRKTHSSQKSPSYRGKKKKKNDLRSSLEGGRRSGIETAGSLGRAVPEKRKRRISEKSARI